MCIHATSLVTSYLRRYGNIHTYVCMIVRARVCERVCIKYIYTHIPTYVPRDPVRVRKKYSWPYSFTYLHLYMHIHLYTHICAVSIPEAANKHRDPHSENREPGFPTPVKIRNHMPTPQSKKRTRVPHTVKDDVTYIHTLHNLGLIYIYTHVHSQLRSFDPNAANKRRGPGRPRQTEGDVMDSARISDWEIVKAGGGMDNNPQPSPFDEVLLCIVYVCVCVCMDLCMYMHKAEGGMDNNPQPSPFDEVLLCIVYVCVYGFMYVYA
jgi:hypothetical protein